MPRFQIEPPGVVRMWFEAAGEAMSHEARGVDRLLHVHPEHGVVQQDLQHALGLEIATRGAERHDERSHGAWPAPGSA